MRIESDAVSREAVYAETNAEVIDKALSCLKHGETESVENWLELLRERFTTTRKNELGDYRTSRGRLFAFTGWPDGGRPTELFDRGDLAGCLHASMFAASRRGNPADIDDDGPLHELVHLLCGIGLCTHNSIEQLRKQIAELEANVDAADQAQTHGHDHDHRQEPR